MSDAVVVTPGQGRVIVFQVNGFEFGYRRPSRADIADTRRKQALKMAPATGLPVEAQTIDILDGDNLRNEASLEIGLVPRKLSDGTILDQGERAPAHWLEAGKVSFVKVDPEEFDAVCAYLDEHCWKKKPNSP